MAYLSIFEFAKKTGLSYAAARRHAVEGNVKTKIERQRKYYIHEDEVKRFFLVPRDALGRLKKRALKDTKDGFPDRPL